MEEEVEEELEELEEEAGAAGKLWSSGGESLTLRRAATSSSTAGPGRCSGRRGQCCSTKASTPSFSAFYDTAPLQLALCHPSSWHIRGRALP